jgi:hypothetical protein
MVSSASFVEATTEEGRNINTNIAKLCKLRVIPYTNDYVAIAAFKCRVRHNGWVGVTITLGGLELGEYFTKSIDRRTKRKEFGPPVHQVDNLAPCS